MRLLLNIIWFVLAGLWMAIGYAIAALICFVLIITIPFGIAALRIGLFALWPFGKTVVKRADAGVAAGIGNVIWFIFCGWWLALGHLVTGVLLYFGLSLIGLDYALVFAVISALLVLIPYYGAFLGGPHKMPGDAEVVGHEGGPAFQRPEAAEQLALRLLRRGDLLPRLGRAAQFPYPGHGRVDDLYHLGLGTPPEHRRPLVWIRMGRAFRIDWSKLRERKPT